MDILNKSGTSNSKNAKTAYKAYDALDKLNSEQKEAVLNTEGPMIILAGAGSGKTRVLIHKVLYLINEEKCRADEILMVTFSNKAAGEMKGRIEKYLNSDNLPTVSTFHSLCARILRRHGVNIGIDHNFVIYDTQDQLSTVKECVSLLDLDPKQARPKAVLEIISSAKNQMIDEKTYKEYAKGYFQEMVASIYPVYQGMLEEHNALDFDDLLLKTLELFRTHKNSLEYYQNKFRYILVDEYQDTNHAQYELTKYLSQKNKNICIVGDFSQSIYSFRGADFRNLEKFKRDFPDSKAFNLSQNYRSTQSILNAAYSVISNNSLHPILKLWTDNESVSDLVIHEADDQHREAEFIIEKVKKLMNNDPSLTLSDIAVLYRMNAQSRTLEEILLHHSIPYKLIGGVRFYDRREVKDVLSYLSYLSNAKDKIAKKRLEKLGKRRFKDFEEYKKDFDEKNYIENKSTIEILDGVLKKTKYLEKYDEKDTEDMGRLENIKELRSVAIEFPELIQFLENVSLVEQEYLPDQTMEFPDDAITLMTMHAAKGLEFRVVFMVGMEEGIFPHSQSLFSIADVEEERRLCYVGITRAKEHIYFTFARERTIFGQRANSTPSRFIFELPEEIRELNGIAYDAGAPDFL